MKSGIRHLLRAVAFGFVLLLVFASGLVALRAEPAKVDGRALASASASALPSADALDAGVVARGTDEVSDAGPIALSAEEGLFYHDVDLLTERPNRLSGSEHAQAAADHIERRLRGIGLTDVFTLDMPVWLLRTRSCTLDVGGTSIRLEPLRPNVIVPPTTPTKGLSAPLIYAGRGEASDYGARSPAGKIVVLDYDSYDGWERAFALGARAVLFVGRGDETVVQPKHAEVPLNQLRFYVSAQALAEAGVDLKQDRDDVTLRSLLHWEKSRGRNVIARIKGTEPTFAGEHAEPEAVVLSAAYDAYGVVPGLAKGARGAANVAALLEAARAFKEQPPRRDLVLMFLDGEAHAHQGAREVYDALLMSPDTDKELSEQHRTELAELDATLGLLAKQKLALASGAKSAPSLALERALADEANFARDDLRKEVQLLRLSKRTRGSGDGSKERELDAERLRWDEIQRALHQDALASFVEAQHAVAAGSGKSSVEGQLYETIFSELERRTRERLERRAAELRELVVIDGQREKLRAALSVDDGGTQKLAWIVLHVNFDLGDGGKSFGVVVGDWTNQLFPWRQPKPDGDNPGYYGRILNALSEAAKLKPLSRLSMATLGDPTLGRTFAPGRFVSSGSVAGAYGIYNVSLMTGYDARPRDGQPGDTFAALDWQRIRELGQQAAELVARAADLKDLSLPRVFKAYAQSKRPGYAGGQSSGYYAGLQVSGSLKENRPATGALVALWPGNQGWSANAWATRDQAAMMPGYDPTVIEGVDERGRFRLLSVPEDMFTEVMGLGALFDEFASVRAVSTQEQQAQKLAGSMRVNLVFAKAYGFTQYRTYETSPDRLKVLKASTDAPFRENRALWGELKNHGFIYVSDQVVDYTLKLFQPMGPVALGEFTSKSPFGAGVPPEELKPGLRLSERSALDLWRLNERRLDQLRARGVTSADLEILHSRARHAADVAKTEPLVALKEAGYLRSASLSQRVYQPLRVAMDDLVHAIVVLLLLAIPFAFAMERLTFCATTVYGRIAGFTGWFLVTFGLLYWLHPGFAIAATPIIIFLAFAIVLLSSLVIYIVVRKFKTELRAIQGQGARGHDLEVSRMGTMLAAIGMGMSTMRRRPTRTTLTAVTVVMLTFTILCFASFSRTVGVRSIYEGPPAQGAPQGVLIRKLDYSEIVPGVLDMLRGEEGEGGLIAAHYWLTRDSSSSGRLSVARADGESLTTDALMGVPLDELERSPELARVFAGMDAAGARRALAEGGVFLPAIMEDVLKVKPGDSVLVAGRSVRVAGTLDGGRLQRLKHLDGQSILPVDFQDAASVAAGGARRDSRAAENELLVADEVDRDFVHLSSDQVIVASSDLVRSLGGKLHVLTLYPGKGIDVAEHGRRLAEIVVMPVWAAGPEGVERLLLTVLTEVSGGLSLGVPLLLGGLIIFGTLLGSISDREKEIYTFSALGLSPGHVGVLFFAEATVYAVVGGMGGQLLAQFVALGASHLARAGVIEPTSINYSSTNSLFAIGVVMLTVLVSAIYPALRASKSANPGLARAWQMPEAKGDRLELKFPFTVSAYDITGVVSFLAEHFRRHDDAGLGDFAASNVGIRRTEQGNLELYGDFALAPFDLGVTQHMTLTAVPSEIPGVDEIAIGIQRESGAASDWHRANRVFIRDLRRQFLLWRTLSNEMIEQYRLETLQTLGEGREEAA